MTKQELRKIYLQKRSNLSEPEYSHLSLSVSNNFFNSIDLTSVNVLHTFLPIKKNKEPDTFLILNRIQKEFPHIQISIPRVNNITNTLENFYLDIAQLKESKWGIPEPQNSSQTNFMDIDAVLIPLLIFDETGHRVGYGKGYYDRFLSCCRKDCKKIGLSLFPPVARIDDVHENDQTLNIAITPKEIFHF